jgi:uncharacterized lipoprotein YmbA
MPYSPQAKTGTLCVLLAPLLLSACLAATSPSPSYYVLISPPEEALPAEGVSARGGPRVGLLPVGLPGYLQRSQMVVREENRVGIRVDDYHRWGEDLGQGINRVLSVVLTNKLADVQGVAMPLRTGVPADFRLQLDVRSFEGRPGDTVFLEVLWTIQRDGRPVREGSFLSQRAAGQGMPALVEAQSLLLEELGTRLAAAFRLLLEENS